MCVVYAHVYSDWWEMLVEDYRWWARGFINPKANECLWIIPGTIDPMED